jgi:hypothetical protein
MKKKKKTVAPVPVPEPIKKKKKKKRAVEVAPVAKASLQGQEIAPKPAPEWRNPTAYVLARRTREGTLEPVSSIEEPDDEQKAAIASALIGTLYMVLRELFANNTALRILLQDDVAFSKQLNTEALTAFEAEQKGLNRKECRSRKPRTVTKKLPKTKPKK